MTFKDYFSGHASAYAKYRPRYPEELFAYLASLVPHNETAWDGATGNGQAAHGLARHFVRVIATDASDKQLENAAPHERITYAIAPAERTSIEADSIDLVTVAQAFHWLDVESFYAEVNRVLRRDGALAVWCYNLLEISPAIDAIIENFYSQTVGAFWSPERQLVEEGYRSLPFPFHEMDAPRFYMRATWSLPDLLGYLRTWSATQNYIRAHEHDPVIDIEEALRPLWGAPELEREIRWLLSLRVGIKEVTSDE